MRVHPACELFPELDPQAYDALKESIRQNGLLEPIWTWQDNATHEELLIDGRSRERACRELGIEPRYERREGAEADIIRFIMGKNLARRHLSASQRAMLGVALLEMLQRAMAEEKAEKARQHNLQATEARIRTLQERILARPEDEADVENSPSSMAPTVAPSDRNNLEEGPTGDRRQRADAREEVARQLGINHTYLSQAKAVMACDPGLADLVRAGKVTLPQARRLLDTVSDEQRATAVELVRSGQVETIRQALKVAREQQAREAVRRGPAAAPLFQLGLGGIPAAKERLQPGSVDLIITEIPAIDPLSACDDLAQAAAVWLKDGASCIVLANPGLLPQVLEVMQRHLDYRWTFAWRTGATSNRAKDRGILNRWRPLIWFGKGPGASATVSDWLSGSSLEDALAELVERLTDPGALVVDPLVGTSNTAVAAVRAGRRFLGFAADAQVVATATARLQKLGLICESPVAAPSPRDDTDDGTAAEQVSDGSSKEHDDEPGDGRHNDSAPDRRADRQIMAVTDPLPSEGDKARQGLLDDMEAAARNVDAEQAAAMTEPEGRDEEPDQPPPALEATGPCSVPAPSLRPNEATQEPSVSTGDAQETILRPVAMAAEGDHLTVWTCEPRSASSPIPGSAPAMGDAGERSSGASLDDVSRSAPPELRPSVLVKRARRASRRRPELTPAQMETAKRLIEQARRRGADVKVINGGLSIVNVSLIPNLTGLLYQHEDLIVACLAGQDGRPGDWTEEAATTEGPEPEPVPTERLHDAAEHASR